jgi:Domain of unknown function (DUF4365)
MPLPREHLLDELATAYVQSVAAAAGATISGTRLDYGVDGTLKPIVKAGNQFIESGFPVDFQLKGTTTASNDLDNIAYDLKVRNYNLLVKRGQRATPYYLFLVCFTKDAEHWLLEEPGRLVFSAAAYWWVGTSDPSDHTTTVRIKIPCGQRLGVADLKVILESAKSRLSA